MIWNFHENRPCFLPPVCDAPHPLFHRLADVLDIYAPYELCGYPPAVNDMTQDLRDHSSGFAFRRNSNFVCGGSRRKQGRNLNLANEGCFAFSNFFCARLASCAVLDPGGRTGDLYPTPGLPRSRKPAVIVDPTIRRAHIVGHHDECPTNLRRALCHFVSFVEMKYLCVFATI